MYGVYDEYKGCVVMYIVQHVHHVHVLLSNGAKWKLNVHNYYVDGSPHRSEAAKFILLFIS